MRHYRKVCEHCRQEYTTLYSEQKYCSRVCAKEAMKINGGTNQPTSEPTDAIDIDGYRLAPDAAWRLVKIKIRNGYYSNTHSKKLYNIKEMIICSEEQPARS